MRTIFMLITMSFIVSSCDVIELNSGIESPSNNNEVQGPDSTPTDETQFLAFLHNNASKVWDAQGFTIAGISGFQDCRLDDQIELFADGTYSYSSGNTLCGAEDSETQRSGSWSLNFAQGIITFTVDGDSFEALVIGLTAEEIVLNASYAGLPVAANYQAL